MPTYYAGFSHPACLSSQTWISTHDRNMLRLTQCLHYKTAAAFTTTVSTSSAIKVPA